MRRLLCEYNLYSLNNILIFTPGSKQTLDQRWPFLFPTLLQRWTIDACVRPNYELLQRVWPTMDHRLSNKFVQRIIGFEFPTLDQRWHPTRFQFASRSATNLWSPSPLQYSYIDIAEFDAHKLYRISAGTSLGLYQHALGEIAYARVGIRASHHNLSIHRQTFNIN